MRIELDSEWGDRAPLAAHGDLARYLQRERRLLGKYTQSLVATLDDPGASEDQRRKALTELGSAGYWIDAKTGAPAFEIQKFVEDRLTALYSPSVTEEQRRETILMLRQMVGLETRESETVSP